MTPHKHAEVIKAWADGHTVQFRASEEDFWRDCTTDYAPAFREDWYYRAKPQPPLVTQEYHLYLPQGMDRAITHPICTADYPANIRLTFEGGKLIDVELIGNA